MQKKCNLQPTIIFDKVSKKFNRGYASDSLRDAVAEPFRRLFDKNGRAGQGQGRSKRQENEFWALRDVSFEVKYGEALGIIGPNGSGKSTALKLLSKILRPDGGKIVVRGRVGALIELAAGFHPDLTGRENVFLNASILGMSKEEIAKRYDEIVDFAELHDFMDTPVKWYSSGMYARLGFSVASHINPEVLLIDEVLSVGDFMFRDKCINKMKEFTESGVTMVVVSHDRHMIEKLCHKGVLLKNGQVVEKGEITYVLDKYYSGLSESKYKDTDLSSRRAAKDDAPIEITKVRMLDMEGNEKNTFLTSDGMKIQIYYRAKDRVIAPCFYSRIFSPRLYSDKGDALLNGTNTERSNLTFECEPGDEGMVELTYKQLNLLNGKYYINVGITPNFFSSNVYDHIDKAATLTISSNIEKGAGVVFIDHNWKVETRQKSQASE